MHIQMLTESMQARRRYALQGLKLLHTRPTSHLHLVPKAKQLTSMFTIEKIKQSFFPSLEGGWKARFQVKLHCTCAEHDTARVLRSRDSLK